MAGWIVALRHAKNQIESEESPMTLAQERTYTIDDIYSLPEGQRAELIDGRMYMMAPPIRIHQKLVSQFTKILILQVIYHDSVLLGVHDPVFPDAGSGFHW